MHGLAVADLQHPVLAELPGVRVPGKIDGLQVPDLVAPQPPAVGHLEQDRVAVGRQPALAAQRRDPVHLVIGPVKEGLQLLPGERAPLGSRFVRLGVDRGVPVEADLRRVRSEVLLADPVPAIIRRRHVGAERPKRGLIAPDRGLGGVLHAAQIPEELIHVGRRPLPRILVRGLLEPRHQPFPAFDGAKRQIPAQLLIPPAGEHLGEHD